jgi:hypothetical protein
MLSNKKRKNKDIFLRIFKENFFPIGKKSFQSIDFLGEIWYNYKVF